jgi:cAMP phosphodiesterase
MRTTSLLVDDDILIDAGTGLEDLSLDELATINHVFITHSHLDHTITLPLMIDSVACLRDTPVTIHANASTIDMIRAYIFNGVIWPDFSEIAIRRCKILTYEAIDIGQQVRLGTRNIVAVPAVHTVSAVGYHLDSGEASLVFTGDTTVNDLFWPIINRIARLRYLIIECSFSNRDEALAHRSRHLCPRLLFSELDKMTVPAEIFVTHLKPRQIDLISAELGEREGRLPPGILRNGQVIEF